MECSAAALDRFDNEVKFGGTIDPALNNVAINTLKQMMEPFKAAASVAK